MTDDIFDDFDGPDDIDDVDVDVELSANDSPDPTRDDLDFDIIIHDDGELELVRAAQSSRQATSQSRR
jgi:hypothetical protein